MVYSCEECRTSFAKLSQLLRHRRTENHLRKYPCDVCGQVISRADNLDRHTLKHKAENNLHCYHCDKVFTRSDNLRRHQLRKHQIGGGQKRPATINTDDHLTKRLKKDDGPLLCYHLQKIREQRMDKFRTKASTYTVHIKNLAEVTEVTKDVLTTLKILFQSIFKDLTRGTQSKDLVRLAVQSPSLDYPIVIPFMKVTDLTADRFMVEIERVLQSNEDFTIEDSLIFEVNLVDMPKGGTGKRCKNVNSDRFLLDKRCIIQIRNEDDLCCARAIVTAKAKIDNDPKWNSIRQGRSVQTELAKQLHKRARVALGKCGIEEIKKFQEVLEGYQLHIVSKGDFNAIIYSGPDTAKKIYLYHHDNHYDVITSMAAFLTKNYFCTQCQKGYDHKEKHKCKNVCHMCCKIHDSNADKEWRHCSICNRYFKGEWCFQLHQKQTMKGNSTCKTMCRCEECGSTVNKKKHKKAHMCGEIFCDVCRDYFPKEHTCYMLSEYDSENNNFTSVEEKLIEEQENPQTFIFFDFECIQDDVVQCKNGFSPDGKGKCEHCFSSKCGAFEHVPNLFIAQKVCNICMDHDVTETSECENCGKNELIFKGANTVYDFCEWLFSEDNYSAVVICHNFQGYDSDAMKSEDREKRLISYSKTSEIQFDFQKELLNYCRSGVNTLRSCSLKFRQDFMDVTTTDPFEKSIKIASACQRVFRTKYSDENSIGIIPTHGYNLQQNQSVKALWWIKYNSHYTGQKIQHAKNGGETRIGEYLVDGYYETEEGRKVVLDFHGDFWHGNPSKFAGTTWNNVKDSTMGALYQKTLDKKRFLEEKGYGYVSIWESDFDRKLAEKETMAAFVRNLELVTPLQPRDAFFGGRTEAFTLYKEASKDERIRFYKITSLYPFINKTGKVPLGRPKIIRDNFEELDTYEGLIKCKVVPPRDLFLPILPCKLNNKLIFALCRTCAESQQQSPCYHAEEERAFIGTWVTDELKKAVQVGYELLTVYEVWHFSRVSQYDPATKTGGAFTEYVNTFLKLKQEARGWPAWCENEHKKEAYIQSYFEKEGICLDYHNIKKNPGMRALAKLMLNSFWDKFGPRSNMSKVETTDDPSIYFDKLTSESEKVTAVNYISEEMVELRWKFKEDFVEPSGKTNVVIAAYTTAQARLKLYSYLERLGPRALYADTDSVVFTTTAGQWEPPLGDFLGDLTDGTPNNSIIKFVTGGPNNYAYHLEHPDENGKLTQCKIRGFTLNHKNLLSITFDTLKHIVLTISQKKDYRLGFDKRVIRDTFVSYPYGF